MNILLLQSQKWSVTLSHEVKKWLWVKLTTLPIDSMYLICPSFLPLLPYCLLPSDHSVAGDLYKLSTVESFQELVQDQILVKTEGPFALAKISWLSLS